MLEKQVERQDAISELEKTSVEKSSIEVLKNLPSYVQDFVLEFTATGDADKALINARKNNKLSSLRPDQRSSEIRALTLNKDVIRAVDEIRKNKSKLSAMVVSNIGSDAIEAWSKVSNKAETLEKINSKIAQLETWVDTAFVNNDMDDYLKLSKEFRSMVDQRDKIEESLRKNINTANDISGISKEKTVIRAGAITVNIGDNPVSKIDKGIIEDIEIDEEEIHDL